MIGRGGEEERPGSLPTGPDWLCLDTMCLILWNNAGHLDLLGRLVGRAFTAEVIAAEELGKSLKNFPQNQRILNAPWLQAAPVENTDAQFVARLLRLWGSGPGQDRGEAEIVALCRKHGWLAITDDKQGRGALETAGLDYAYMSSLLLAAAALQLEGLDAASAWAVHHAVESGRNAPRIYREGVFHQCVALVERLWKQAGEPAWPEFVGNPGIDYLVDRADKRQPPRPLRS